MAEQIRALIIGRLTTIKQKIVDAQLQPIDEVMNDLWENGLQSHAPTQQAQQPTGPLGKALSKARVLMQPQHAKCYSQILDYLENTDNTERFVYDPDIEIKNKHFIN